MNRFFSRISLILTLSALGASAQASTGAHGGGDNKTKPDHHAWFVGNAAGKEVSYCVSFAHSHRGFKLERVQFALTNAFVRWSTYRSDRAPENAAFANLRPKYVGSCSQQDAADLKILVGKDVGGHNELFGPAWNRIDSGDFQNPAAFSNLESYDVKKGWGKGFIWLHSGNPFTYRVDQDESVDLQWSYPGSIEMLFLHEVGHVLGIGHVSGTIMDEDILHRLYVEQKKGQSANHQWLTAIDDTQELLPQDIKELDGHNPAELRVLINKKYFHMGFNEPRNADVPARITWPKGIENPYTIIVDDIGANFPIRVRPSKVLKTIVTTPPIFNVCLDPTVSGKKSPCNGIERKSFIQVAELFWPVMTTQVMINFNLPNRADRIYNSENKSQHILSIDQIFNEESQPALIRSISASEGN